VRIVRALEGHTAMVSGFVSTDGVAWRQIGTAVRISMTAQALAGMAVTTHADPHPLQDLCSAVVDRMALSSWPDH
jgi:hypothetical protein